jgi:hypothetical protein
MKFARQNMSKGLRTRDLPKWVHKGIASAFNTWLDMAGEWLNSAPEYLVTVSIAEQIRRNVDANQRTVLLEPSVSETLKKAGGIQRGKNAEKLRHTGRYDIVIGHKDMRPRAVIEVKSPRWHPLDKPMRSDLNRLCKTLLQNKNGTNIHSALMAIYVASRAPTRKDETARSRLERKWALEMPTNLKDCSWATNKLQFSSNLNFRVHTKFYDYESTDGKFAWGSVCIEITRKPPSQLKEI